MSEFKDLIKSDLEGDFTPRFQDLSKKMPTGFTDTIKPPKAPMTAPSGAGGGGKPPKAPVAPMAPSDPDKKPKITGKPKPTPTTMKKQGMNEGGNEDRFHIYHQGQKLTQDHETVTASDVNKKYGGVKNLEAKGFLLVPHKTAPKAQPQKAVMAGQQSQTKKPFLGKDEHKPGGRAKSLRQIMKRPKRKLVRKDEISDSFESMEKAKRSKTRPPHYKPKEGETPEWHENRAKEHEELATGKLSIHIKDNGLHRKYAEWHTERAKKLKSGDLKSTNPVIKSEVMGQFKPMFNDINEIAKKSPAIALNCLSIDDLVKANTNNAIVGQHIPNDPAPAPKPKKVKGNKDEGSGGGVKKEQVKEDLKKPSIPANKIIKPEDDKKRLINKYDADTDGSESGETGTDEPAWVYGTP